MIQKNKNTNKDVIKPEKFSQHYKSNDEKKKLKLMLTSYVKPYFPKLFFLGKTLKFKKSCSGAERDCKLNSS